MIVFYPKNHYQHNILEIVNGITVSSVEIPERINRIKDALEKNGNFEFKKLVLCNDELIAQVHDKNYLEFLKNNSSQQLEYSSVFDYTKHTLNPQNLIAQKGFFIFDTYTPLTTKIWQVAKESASCAVSGSDIILKREKVVYALCRPPGHHATKNMAGGYCYLNNTAIAAQNLLNKGAKKVAILDIDFHHGNGTQDIFYDKNEVLLVFIHADPTRKFPYFTGYSGENGQGKGKGFNYNFPLPADINDHQYLKILIKVLDLINNFSPQYLVVSVGFDPYEKDPICDFKITIKGFNHIGQQIARLPYPTLLVQEGGYNLEDLGKCAISFLTPFLTIKKYL